MAIATPQCWTDVDNVLNAGIDRVLLYGPPGTGKTNAGLRQGVDPRLGAYRLICTEDMTTADVVGMFLPSREGGFSWLDGAATKAWQGDGYRGTRLVIDEIDLASGDVLAQLLAMTDSPESAEMLHPGTGRVIRPLAGFSVVMTTNMEDPDELPAALRDRFPIAINVNAAHPAAVEALPTDLQALAMAMSTAETHRRASIRAFKAFAELRKSMNQEEAARLVFGEEKCEAINDALRINATGGY